MAHWLNTAHFNEVYSLLLCPVLALVGLALPVNAEPDQATPPNLPGVCGQIYDLAGRAVVINGQVIRLVDSCTQRRAAAAAQPVTPQTTRPDTSSETQPTQNERFWESFLAIANPAAEHFAVGAGQEDVINYGKTICSILEGGTSLADLQQMQLAGGLPQNFDTAVTSAAINIYCPQHRSTSQ